MRIDKFLKISRLIKRRVIAKEACDNGRILANGRPIKASYDVQVGDEVTIRYTSRDLNFKVLKLSESTKKEDAVDMIEILE